MAPGLLFGAIIGATAASNCQRQPRLMGRSVALSRISRKDPIAGQKALEFYELWDQVRNLTFDFVYFWIVILSVILSLGLVGLCYLNLLPVLQIWPLYEFSYLLTTLPLMVLFSPFAYFISRWACKSKRQALLEKLQKLTETTDKWVWEQIARFDPYTAKDAASVLDVA